MERWLPDQDQPINKRPETANSQDLYMMHGIKPTRFDTERPRPATSNMYSVYQNESENADTPHRELTTIDESKSTAPRPPAKTAEEIISQVPPPIKRNIQTAPARTTQTRARQSSGINLPPGVAVSNRLNTAPAKIGTSRWARKRTDVTASLR